MYRAPRTSRFRRDRRMQRNAEGGLVQGLLLPSLVGAGGLLLSQWADENLVTRLLPQQDRRVTALVSGMGMGAIVYAMGGNIGLGAETIRAASVGAGISALMPWLPPVLRSGSAPSNPTSGMGLMVDVSHYGAPYKGLFGLGQTPQDIAAVSTIIPRDLSFPAPKRAQVKAVTVPFASARAERSASGGLFARQLFSGMNP